MSAILLAIVALASLIGPELLPDSYAQPSATTFAEPSWQHPFGTDLNGRDLLYRVLAGGRISLLVGLCGAIVSLFIGTVYGLVAGYVGGRVDNAMMRIVRHPVLRAAADFHPDLHQCLQCAVPGMGDADGLDRARDIVEDHHSDRIAGRDRMADAGANRARADAGAEEPRVRNRCRWRWGRATKILTRHLLPNLLGVVIIYLTLTIPSVIIDESFLSFLGLGVQSPMSSWGSLLSDGAGALNPIRIRWWLVVFPAIAMATTLLSLNILGDALRDSLDPKR